MIADEYGSRRLRLAMKAWPHTRIPAAEAANENHPPGAAAYDPAAGAPPPPLVRFNAWVGIAADGMVTVAAADNRPGGHGRGSPPQVVADVLDLPMCRLLTERASGERTGPGADGALIGRAASDVRSRLIEAARRRWAADGGDCVYEAGEVVHLPTGARLTIGELAAEAAALPAPSATAQTWSGI